MVDERQELANKIKAMNQVISLFLESEKRELVVAVWLEEQASELIRLYRSTIGH